MLATAAFLYAFAIALTTFWIVYLLGTWKLRHPPVTKVVVQRRPQGSRSLSATSRRTTTQQMISSAPESLEAPGNLWEEDED